MVSRPIQRNLNRRDGIAHLLATKSIPAAISGYYFGAKGRPCRVAASFNKQIQENDPTVSSSNSGNKYCAKCRPPANHQGRGEIANQLLRNLEADITLLSSRQLPRLPSTPVRIAELQWGLYRNEDLAQSTSKPYRRRPPPGGNQA